jgi:hypothetical protein
MIMNTSLTSFSTPFALIALGGLSRHSEAPITS